MAVNVFVFGEMFYLFNCRSLKQASWKTAARANFYLWGGVGLMIVLQMLYTYVPGMNTLFGSAPMTLGEWALVIGAGIAIHVAVEVEKWFTRRRPDKKPDTKTC